MFFLYVFIALFISWIWIEYFRLIDVFEKESLFSLLTAFVLGCVSVTFVMLVKPFEERFLFSRSDLFINNLLFWIVNVGAVEELAKSLPFIIVFIIFRRKINEPVDYLILFSVSALGFSAVENILYFQSRGISIVLMRAILSTVGHMFDTALIAYGVILYKYRKRNPLIIVWFFLLASVIHGLYDFIIVFELFRQFGFLILILYFMVCVSLFATILNNSLNNSTFFTYKKVVNAPKVSNRILLYYVILVGVVFVVESVFKGIEVAIKEFYSLSLATAIIIAITVTRLSRFRLIKNRWESLKFELPFEFIRGDHYYAMGPRLHIALKGESINEALINQYYEEYFKICPVSSRSSFIGEERLAYIEKKIFLRNLSALFVVRVFQDDKDGASEIFLLSAKVNGITKFNSKYPLVALLSVDDESGLDSINSVQELNFHEWVCLLPLTE